MKKILLINSLLLLLFANSSYAQFYSALESIAGNKCTLERDPIFYDLHDDILSSKIEPGMKTEIINQKMQNVRTQILKTYDDKITNFRVKYHNNKLYLVIDNTSISLLTVDNVSNPDSLKKGLIEGLSNELKKLNVLGKIRLLDNEIELLGQTSRYVLKDNPIGIRTDFTIDIDDVDGEKALYLTISEIIVDNLFNYLTKIIDKRTETDLVKYEQSINQYIDQIKQTIRDEIVQLLDKVEGEIDNLIEDANQWLISANIGIGITSGKSSIAPGILIGSINKDWNFSLFITGVLPEFSNPPTDSSGKKYNDVGILTGGSGSYRLNTSFEIQALLSYRIFQEDINLQTQTIEQEWKISEQGIGLNFRFPISKYSFIVSPVYYFQYDWNHKGIKDTRSIAYMTGFRFKKGKIESPSIFLGISSKKDEDEVSYIFQIGVPFNIVGN